MNRYELLANAVIVQAAEDYRKALVKQKKCNIQVEELERFFTGETFNNFTNLDGPELMKKLHTEVIENHYDLKSIERSQKLIDGEES